MNVHGRTDVLRFTRGRHSYLITPPYTGEPGYVGLCDGQVIVGAPDRAEVAKALIRRRPSGA